MELAEAGQRLLLDWLTANSDHLWEYYDSRSGHGKGVRQYGWTAARAIELILGWNSPEDP